MVVHTRLTVNGIRSWLILGMVLAFLKNSFGFTCNSGGLGVKSYSPKTQAYYYSSTITNYEIQNVFFGQTSGDLYTFAYAYTTDHIALHREQDDGTLVYDRAYTGYSNPYGTYLTDNENMIYELIEIDAIQTNIAVFDATNGDFLNVRQMTSGAKCSLGSQCNLKANADGSIAYFSAQHVNNDNSMTCKYLYSTTKVNCYFDTYYKSGMNMQMIDDDTIYYGHLGRFPPLEFRFMKVTFGTSVDWAYSTECSTGSCVLADTFHITAFNDDKSYIFNYLSFNSESIWFTSNTSSGEVINTNVYGLSTFCGTGFDLKSQNDIAVATVDCGQPFIIRYDPDEDTFEYYEFSSASMNMVYMGIEASGAQRLVFGGEYNNIGDLVYTYTDFLNIHPDFQESTIGTFSAYAAGVQDVAPSHPTPVLSWGSDRSMTTASVTVTEATGFGITAEASRDYSGDNFYTYGIKYTFNDLDISTDYNKTVDFSCTDSGTYQFTYSRSAYLSNPVPTWPVFNTTSGNLDISTPADTINTTYKFNYDTLSSNGDVVGSSLVTIGVIGCYIANCDACVSEDVNTCNTCSSGYVNDGPDCSLNPIPPLGCFVSDCDVCVVGDPDVCSTCASGYDNLGDGCALDPIPPDGCTVANCDECTLGDPTDCIDCSDNFQPLGDECVDDPIPPIGCTPANCALCTLGDPDDCVDCLTDFQFLGDDCVNDPYPLAGCNPANCAECTLGDPNDCITCATNYQFLGDDCVNDPYYPDGCDYADCDECELGDSTVCIDCATGFTEFEGGCAVDPYPPAGCTQSNCVECELGDPTVCIDCTTGYLQDGDGCSIEPYPPSGCNVPNCAECDLGDPATCDTCATNYQFSGTDCVDDPYPPNGCNEANCAVCVLGDPDTCDTCATGYQFLGTDCVNDPYPPDGCNPDNCAECTLGDPEDCIDCNDFYSFIGDDCVLDPYPPFGCLIDNCTLCEIGDENLCLECLDNFKLTNNACEYEEEGIDCYISSIDDSGWCIGSIVVITIAVAVAVLIILAVVIYLISNAKKSSRLKAQNKAKSKPQRPIESEDDLHYEPDDPLPQEPENMFQRPSIDTGSNPGSDKKMEKNKDERSISFSVEEQYVRG